MTRIATPLTVTTGVRSSNPAQHARSDPRVNAASGLENTRARTMTRQHGPRSWATRCSQPPSSRSRFLPLGHDVVSGPVNRVPLLRLGRGPTRTDARRTFTRTPTPSYPPVCAATRPHEHTSLGQNAVNEAVRAGSGFRKLTDRLTRLITEGQIRDPPHTFRTNNSAARPGRFSVVHSLLQTQSWPGSGGADPPAYARQHHHPTAWLPLSGTRRAPHHAKPAHLRHRHMPHGRSHCVEGFVPLVEYNR